MQYGVNPKYATFVHQEHLLNTVRDLFPNAKTEVNARDALQAPGRTVMEFDMFLPDEALCFEFQDSYHYVTTWYNQKALQRIKQSDGTKASTALSNNMSMVVVPCWWDGKPESLAATIQFERPDMPFDGFQQLIPLTPPRGFFLSSDLPNVGELMLASFPQDIQSELVPLNWWMGEKYDGIRCCWNPLESTLYTRSGRHVPLPLNMMKRLPKIFIDGEFWFGRGQFAAACLLVTGSPEYLEGQFLRLMAFDNPRNKMQKLPFEERYKTLIQRVLYKNSTHLKWSIHCIVDDEGEGVILRRIKTKYEHGRTPSLLKLKISKGDKEAVVVEKRQEDSSLIIALPNGRVVPVPATHIHVPLPDVGAIVSFFYESYSRNRDVPVHPQVYRVRSDLSWQDVIKSTTEEEKYEDDQESSKDTQMSEMATTNMRMFLEDFAKSRNLDPHKPETWYNIPYRVFYNNKGARAIIQKFRGGYYKALLHVFPDIGLKVETFNRLLWTDVSNRRKFFELFARQHSFDPLVADNWYTQQRDSILEMKGASRVLTYHDNSVVQAIADLFPDIGIDKTKFQASFWFKDSRVKFFIKYAQKMNFDPLVPENWYKIPKDHIAALQGADKVMAFYENSVSKALIELFPDVPFQRKKFTAWAMWQTPEARRRFFEEYAKARRFSPLIPEFWYEQSRDSLLGAKGAMRVLYYHGYSLARALSELFPEVQFDPAKFNMLSMWSSPKIRKKFFDEFAAKEGFDPNVATNWYRYQLEQISFTKASVKVAKYHNKDLRQALIDLYPEVEFDITKLFPSSDKGIVARRFFNKYAAERGFDPLEPENWYQQPYSVISTTPGYQDAVQDFSSVARALFSAYPHIGLIPGQFLLQHVRRDKEKMQQFFEKYATAYNFDPLVPANWYRQAATKIIAFKGSSSVLAFFNNSVTRALLATYPDIGIDKDRFHNLLEYREPQTRRGFFENYASEHGFDPLEPNNWYVQPAARIMATRGASKVMHFHHGNISKALVALFPEVGIERQGFQDRYVYKDPAIRRRFFENFAKLNNFDPLVADNWYQVRREEIIAIPGALSILHHHQSYARALIDLFPEIGLDKSKFPSAFGRDPKKSLMSGGKLPGGKLGELPGGSLQEPPGGTMFSRRKFFETYAHERGFDPLNVENWYQEQIPRIMATKGASKVVLKHGSIVKGLIDLFPELDIDKAGFHRRRR